MNQNLYIYYFFICCLSNSLCNKKFSWDRLGGWGQNIFEAFKSQ